MSQTATVTVGAVVTQTQTLDIATAEAPLLYTLLYNWSSGTGRDQSTIFVSDTRTLAAGAAESFDLYGGLLDIFGGPAFFTRLRAILVEVTSTSTSTLSVGTDAAAPFGGPFVSVAGNGAVGIQPDSSWCAVAPNAAGWEVIPATNDLIRFSASGGVSCTYHLTLIGAT